jgi:hypothetical protein
MENQPQTNQETAAVETQPLTAAKSYNPFIVNVNEKPYAQMNVNVGQQQMASPIPEPTYQSNTVSSNENAYNMLNNEFSMNGGSPVNSTKDSPPFNPAMNNIPDADKKLGAEHMTKLIIDGYEQLHVFGNNMLQISDSKVRKMVADGEIDLSVQIPYEYGKTIGVGEFIQDFNEQNKDTLSVSKEFKKEVTPVLTRVLQKRGAGVTDEQYLGYLFAKDIIVKGVIVTQIRGTMNSMFEVMKEYTQALKENGTMAEGTPYKKQTQEQTKTPPSPPSDDENPRPQRQRPTPPPRSVVVKEEDAENMVFDESFNFDTNETVIESRIVQRHKVPDSGKERLMQQRKEEREIKAAMERAAKLGDGIVNPIKGSYQDAINSKKSGKRGKKTSDYIAQVDEKEIAEAIILNESKPIDKDKIEGLD